MMKHWWKALSVLLIIYTIFYGFMGDVPRMPILNETIRNLYFHVTMWFSMMIILTVSLVYSIKQLSNPSFRNDTIAVQAVNVSLLLGFMGLATGSLWARYTWGAWWVNDPQLNGAAITILAYLAYTLLRNSFEDEQKRARIAAVYNIFAYVMMIIFIGIIPKFSGVDSLHPGKGGNPGFNSYDLDSGMRAVFYPAIIGWTLLAVWMMNIRIRLNVLKNKN